MLSKQYIQAFKVIQDKLSKEKLSWAIYGSSGLALRGLPFEAHDIDILMDKDGALRMNDLLKEYVVTPVYFDQRSERFESYIGEFCVNGIKVEPIGNFHRKKNGKKISLTHIIQQPEFIRLDNIMIPVVSLQRQLEAYRLCNREKDQIKVQKIKDVLGF